MNEHPASPGHEPPEVIVGKQITVQALEREEVSLDISSELADYFPEHLSDFYDLLKEDCKHIHRSNQILFYETRIIIWLCIIAGIIVSFKASFVGGSIVSIASIVAGGITRFIKIKNRPRDELDKRLEALRLTALDIERICLRIRFADAITDIEQKNELLASLARGEAGRPGTRGPQHEEHRAGEHSHHEHDHRSRSSHNE